MKALSRAAPAPTDAVEPAAIQEIELGPAHVAVAREARARLLATIDLGRDAAIDLRSTPRLDAAGIQLLLAAAATLRRSGRQLWLIVGDGPVVDALRASGAMARLRLVRPEATKEGHST
jgi:anti-anti-sigma regulatory factor